jgi:hypothetical protein
MANADRKKVDRIFIGSLRTALMIDELPW